MQQLSKIFALPVSPAIALAKAGLSAHGLTKAGLFAVVLSFFGLTAHAQDTWSLERCIQYAKDNNITVKQAQANVRTAMLSEKQAKASRLPNVSANANVGEQFGRTIDPTTNQFSTVATSFNSLGLNAGINLFSGGLINHSIKQAGWDLQAASADAEQLVNNLGLQIASAYLSILLGEEQLENAGKRIQQTQEQLNVTMKLIDGGTLPMADKYNILAQLAQGEQAAVQARNSVELAYLSLKQLLQLEPDFDLRIDRPDVSIPVEANPDALSLSPVYQTAVNTQANIRAADFRVNSARESIAIAKSAYYPTISAYANLSSSYSSQARDFNNPIIGDPVLGTPEIVNIGGQDIPVSYYYIPVTFPKTTYFDQIDQNFGQGIGASIQIPIYQNGRTRLNVERARLGVLTSQMQQIQTQQLLKNDIQTAIANARAARLTLEAAQKTFDATEIAYQNTVKRHTLGTINTLDLTTARNNRDIAETDRTVAKYDYIFKLKILDFYLGKPLNMD
ncbi:MAG: TolC family protein [Saprospiraceae bacterium]|nr:TolC family protein [Saprospiraceae bacterium]